MKLKNLFQISTFVVLFTAFPLNSAQDTVTGTCIFDYFQQFDRRILYECRLFNAVIRNPTDVLQITGNHIQNHTDADVEALSHNARILYFNGEILRIFENLKVLNLLSLGLKEISSNGFESCSKLEELRLGIDELTTFPPQMLKNCGNLKKFMAVYLNMSEIPEDLFGETQNLEEFRVENNQLTSLPENLLRNMKNLKYFKADSNLLTELSSNLLKNAVNLVSIILSKNNFADQDKVTNILKEHKNLKHILLDNNNFTNFDFNCFSQFEKLEVMSIGSTAGPQLTQISWISLPGSLTDLSAYGINEEIPEKSFDKLSNLISLKLTGLGIENIHKDIFKSMTKLEVLSIQNTNLKSLDSNLFINQAALTDLNLSNNKIEALPVGIFTNLVNIGTKAADGIRLHNNNIQRLNSNSFGQHPNLQYLTFSDNKINEIQRGIFSKFSTKMTSVTFSNNLCIDNSFFSDDNFADDESFELCYQNWDDTEPETTTTTEASPTTTPGGCGSNFKKFEVYLVLFIGFFVRILKL